MVGQGLVVSVDAIIWFSGILLEVIVIGLLIFRGTWRIFPIFFAYNVWSLIGNAGVEAVLYWEDFSSHLYISAYFVNMLIDSVLTFGVLVELTWSVLRPIRLALPRGALIVLTFLLIAAGAAIWPFTFVPGKIPMAAELILLLRFKQAFSALSIVAFLVLAAFSQLLALGWRHREMQIATGLGLYSLVSLAVTLLHTWPAMLPQYNLLDYLVVASYFCSLLYWIVSFSQQEEARREFSPQMQNLLLAMAGAARTTRVALTDSQADSKSKGGK